MKDKSSVFLLTLVDFLVQIIFVGLFLYVIEVSVQSSEKGKITSIEDQLGEITKSYGVSDFVKLTDELTKLIPAKDFKSDEVKKKWKDLVDKDGVKEIIKKVELLDKQGGINELEKKVALVNNEGGIKDLEKKLDEWANCTGKSRGYGKPPCFYILDKNGNKIPKDIATIIVTDTTVTFEAETEELQEILFKLGYTFDEVNSLSINDFVINFRKLKEVYTECNCHVRYIDKSGKLAPYKAIRNSGFIPRF